MEEKSSERSKNLEEEINNKDLQNGHLKAKVGRLKHRLRIETDASMKLDSLNGEYLQGFSQCQKELEECEKKLERREHTQDI